MFRQLKAGQRRFQAFSPQAGRSGGLSLAPGPCNA